MTTRKENKSQNEQKEMITNNVFETHLMSTKKQTFLANLTHVAFPSQSTQNQKVRSLTNEKDAHF